MNSTLGHTCLVPTLLLRLFRAVKGYSAIYSCPCVQREEEPREERARLLVCIGWRRSPDLKESVIH